MGLYNFHERFVPKILAGEKTHTIRAERAVMDRPGATMHLYVGLRHKGAMCIGRPVCSKVEKIQITAYGNVVIDGMMLACDELELLARRDGFESHKEMMQFWEGRLPFTGHVYHWRKPSTITRENS